MLFSYPQCKIDSIITCLEKPTHRRTNCDQKRRRANQNSNFLSGVTWTHLKAGVPKLSTLILKANLER